MLMTLAWIGAALGPLALWRLAGGRRWILTALLATAYTLGVWAFLIEPELLVVRQVTVASAAWRGPRLRIGVISDLHVGDPHMSAARARRVAERLAQERPDLIVLLGDVVGGSAPLRGRSAAEAAELDAGIAAMKAARAPLGHVAVLGNHDWWYDGQTIEAAERRAGATVLANSAVRIDRPDGAFWVAGVEDLWSTRAQPAPNRALAEVPAGAPVILLAHEPDAFAAVPPRVALTLAGHTHCGQVSLPLIGRPILPSPGSRRWPCGLYDEGGRKLYVTGGVGVSILPARFRAPPEIVIVTLRAAP